MNTEDYDYSNTTIDKETAVTAYGSDGSKNQFNKKKKLSANLEKGLILSLEQYYESVEKVRVGRSFHYKLGDKRLVTAQRNDGRSFLGARSKTALPYTKDMDIVVANYLNRGDDKESKTLKRWLIDVGIISKGMSDAMNARRNLYNSKHILEELYAEKIIREEYDEYTVNDYLQINEELLGQMDNTLRRLERAETIRIKKRYFKKVKKILVEDSFDSRFATIEISEEEYLNHKKQELNLLKRYGITAWESLYGKSEGNVKKYRLEKNNISKAKIYEDGKEIKVKTYFYFSSTEVKKVSEDIILSYLKAYKYDTDSYTEDKDMFVKDSITSFKNKRYERVKQKMNDKITKRFKNDINGMEKFGVKKSKTFKPAEYNKVVDNLQRRYTGLCAKKEEEIEHDKFSQTINTYRGTAKKYSI